MVCFFVFLRISLVRCCPTVGLACPHPAHAQRLDAWSCWVWLSVSSCVHDPQPLQLWSCLLWCVSGAVLSVLYRLVLLSCPCHVHPAA